MENFIFCAVTEWEQIYDCEKKYVGFFFIFSLSTSTINKQNSGFMGYFSLEKSLNSQFFH